MRHTHARPITLSVRACSLYGNLARNTTQAVAHGLVRTFILALVLSTAPLTSAQVKPAPATAFDHSHAAWDALLRQHVVVHADGNASGVDYAGLVRDHAALKGYLSSLSAVTPAEFEAWSKPKRLAFLINAYNAFTVELILTRYPKLESIKEIGGFFSSPWKQRFFTLLGAERTLDDVEHGMIRAPGVYDEPRIHVAVVCASIGCPMLRDSAFVADKIDSQLAYAMARFLADKTRNRYDAARKTLYISKIFDWYGGDFALQGDTRRGLLQLFARHAGQLTISAAERDALLAAIRADDVRIDHLDYDWRLNDASGALAGKPPAR